MHAVILIIIAIRVKNTLEGGRRVEGDGAGGNSIDESKSFLGGGFPLRVDGVRELGLSLRDYMSERECGMSFLAEGEGREGGLL